MVEKKIEIPKEILRFLTGIYYEDNEDEELRRKKIFDRAFDMAYKDMATHTVAYRKYSEEYKKYIADDNARTKKNKEKVRNAIKEHIKRFFIEDNYSLSKLLTDEDFDKWHKNVCDSIVNLERCNVKGLEPQNEANSEVRISLFLGHIYKNVHCKVFTYGQAQKLVNMMLKYLYIYYQCEGWADFEKIVSYFHVPIDSRVLKVVFHENGKYNGKAWSKFLDYEKDYMPCQREIEKFVKNKTNYSNAFAWELTEWPFK